MKTYTATLEQHSRQMAHAEAIAAKVLATTIEQYRREGFKLESVCMDELIFVKDDNHGQSK